MRFDPRLIRADEAPLSPDGQIDLPADLGALAEQLCDDAMHLAATYPPAQVARPVEVAAPSWRKQVAVAAAVFCSAALAMAIGIALILQSPLLVAPRSGNGQARKSPPSFTSVLPAPEAPVSLIDLSGPELEAWLDLQQRAAAPNISVSF